jgi:C-terminal processing protease CtpA/Prc
MDKYYLHRISFLLLAFLVGVQLQVATVGAQVSGTDRDMAVTMLDRTKQAIRDNYYDPTFHGVDLDFVFDQAKARIKAAPTRDALMLTVASAVMSLDDSHTTFFPPARAAEIDYGWQVGAVGNDIYVTRIKPRSDAEAKGLKPGDKLLAIDNFRPTRKNLWQLYYRYFAVAPAASVKMTILRPGEEKPETLTINTKISKTSELMSYQMMYDKYARKGYFDSGKAFETRRFGDELAIVKMHSFSITEQSLDHTMSNIKNHKTLIIDLRGNGGGAASILKRMIGFFFDKEIKIGDEKKRKETKPFIAKSRGGDVFKGKLIVLVDRESASASEVFAKVIQLNGRGKVIGDLSAGSVMESEYQQIDGGFGRNLWFGASVTVADLIMTDGKSLEKVGVTPDEIVLPTGRDLAEAKDPVLSHAAKIAGVDISPEKAGTFFPYEWPK